MAVANRTGLAMLARATIVALSVLAAAPASAQQLTPDAARRFVVGKLFAYNCFDGTRGMGRIYGDGSVLGTVQFQGKGPVRYARLPAGTLRVRGAAICASLRGMPFEPCFNLQQTSDHSFRGAVSGLGIAYCDFTRSSQRANLARTALRPRSLQPTQVTPPVQSAATTDAR
jgi:hypothetical protein